ncbi:MAG: tyrosine-type recombinase/integrase [Haloferacaceae archaeon]
MPLEPIEPAKAVTMYLQERDGELSEASLQAHDYRLNHFTRWCDEEGVTDMTSLTGRRLHEYRLWRQSDGDLAPPSLKTQMDTLRVFVRFCERIDAVPEGLHDKVQSPSLSDGENERDVMLEAESAKAILNRLSRFRYASRDHVVMTLLWRTGIRMGSLRSLDLSNYYPRKGRLELEHDPDRDTPLKNGAEGERYVAIRPVTVEIVDDWIDHQRPERTDEYGRQPLITTTHGRISRTSIRDTVYRLTRPCDRGNECPHDRDPETCEATDDHRKQASKCPSSVSPHAVRRGSITHHLTQDVPEKVVSDRMNVSQEVLDKHYDERTEEVKVEQRRGYLSNL